MAENYTRRKKVNKKKRRRRRRILFVFEFVILLILCGVLWVMAKLDKLQTGEQIGDLAINDIESEEIGGYKNIALFGIDSRDGTYEKGARTDCIIIASINNKTKEVKLVSVYRDTYLKQGEDKYTKANAAYASGGAEAAIQMLDTNLDLDITEYVTVDFSAVTSAVDLLGGIEVEITDAERVHLNNHAIETAKVTGVKTTKIKEAGLVTLDGVQATSYTRIRQTEGDDFKRTERQRLVIEKIIEKAKETDLGTLNDIIDEVFPKVSTNLSAVEIIKLASDIRAYELGDTRGFPFDYTPKKMGKSGECIIPTGLSQNVTQLHEFLFAGEAYAPSGTVETISDIIVEKSGVKSPKKNEGNSS